jgi:glycosyltransferase involved in cell wall biosynthesis
MMKDEPQKIQMKPTKIFVDCHVFDGSFQGTTTYLKGMYLEMIKDKTIQYFFAASDLEKVESIFGAQENVYYLKYRSRNKIYRLLIDIPRLIKKNNIDFAHFQYIVPPIKNCKYINTIHDVLFLDYPNYFPKLYQIKNKFLFKWSAKKSDINLTVSEFSKQKIQQHFDIHHIKITPNAVDPVYYEPYDKTVCKQKVKEIYNIDKYWLYISRWEPRKNHDTLLKVFVENQFYKEFSLVFIGDISIKNKAYNNYYQNLSNEVKAKILTLNKVDFQQLLLLLRAADLSVYPSHAEGFGIPPLESVAAGIPTACSNSTSMLDFTFMNGNQFNPADKENMAEIIIKTLAEKVESSKIETLKVQYNWKLSSEVLENRNQYFISTI